VREKLEYRRLARSCGPCSAFTLWHAQSFWRSGPFACPRLDMPTQCLEHVANVNHEIEQPNSFMLTPSCGPTSPRLHVLLVLQERVPAIA
jgi:hypothetical protein